jgi:poly(3-hydroxybutyrate) depolymerase
MRMQQGFMKRITKVVGVILLSATAAHAQITDALIEVALERKQSGEPVQLRAILGKPAAPADTALLIYRGVPGYALIKSTGDKQRNLPAFIRVNQRLFSEAGIALVVMDCPTDQWGPPGVLGTNCHDDYRSSRTHADDVRTIIARLKGEHGIAKIFVLGHSQGSISSRWLAVHLGNEIDGSIHSASVNVPNKLGHYSSVGRIPYAAIRTPVLHIHHQDDGCRGTPYAMVQRYAGANLTTVRGGVAEGDPCGGGHLHSFQGREEAASKAVIEWIKTGKVVPAAGE